jgi:internalin A
MGMKQILLMIAVVALVGCGKKPLTKEESVEVIEAAIREAIKKPTGELAKADLEKLTYLDLFGNQLTDVNCLEKLTQLTCLGLGRNELTEVPRGLEELTQLKELKLHKNQLTSVKGLEKLTQLKVLHLRNNPDLTKAQKLELKKALPKCAIFPNP